MMTHIATMHAVARRGTVAVGMLLVLAACGSGGDNGDTASASSGGGTKQVTVGSTDAGDALVNDAGMTMYAFAADSKGHSACTGSCLGYWPPVSGDEKAHVASTVTAPVGTITRDDGSTQLTVAGFPMYTYAGDSSPGQANGQGKDLSGGLWWVVAADGSWVKTSAGDSGSGSGGGGGYGSSSGGGGGY
jgi:predicted lipoprotein with Yx(FWY)xxD motif